MLSQNFLTTKNSYKNSEASNQNLINYSRIISPVISDICEPLNNFGIKMFTYSRIYNGGRRLYVSTNHDWVEHYITHDFHEDIDHLHHYVPVDGIKYAFWDSFKKDIVFDATLNQFNFWNGFSVYEKNNDYVDFFDFGAHKHNTKINNFYINNLYLLIRFIEYFKEKTFLIINSEDKENTLVPKIWVSFDKIRREENNFSKNIDCFSEYTQRGEQIRLKNEALNLTNRELECLKLLYKGNTIKNIARILKISSKTVEFYLNNCKMKTQVRTEVDLIYLYGNHISYCEN